MGPKADGHHHFGCHVTMCSRQRYLRLPMHGCSNTVNVPHTKTNHGRPMVQVLARVLGSMAVLVTTLGMPVVTLASDAAFGQYLAGECVTCHRKDGQNKGIPSITGWPTDQFVAVMRSYKQKVRPNPIMQTIAGRLTDQDMDALAAYYASLRPD
jgi:cytochrome c553